MINNESQPAAAVEHTWYRGNLSFNALDERFGSTGRRNTTQLDPECPLTMDSSIRALQHTDEEVHQSTMYTAYKSSGFSSENRCGCLNIMADDGGYFTSCLVTCSLIIHITCEER